MADEDLDLDVKSSSKSTTILLIVLIVLVLAAAGGGAAMFLMGGEDAASDEAEAVTTEEAAPKPKTAHYLSLKPEFVVNLEDNSRANYLQLEMQLMSRNAQILSSVEQHMPAIRNDILILLGGQKFETLSTREGKEQLRKDIVTAIHKTLELSAKDEGIESVYFTSLIMQ